jgi:hypothetical protein
MKPANHRATSRAPRCASNNQVVSRAAIPLEVTDPRREPIRRSPDWCMEIVYFQLYKSRAENALPSRSPQLRLRRPPSASTNFIQRDNVRVQDVLTNC